MASASSSDESRTVIEPAATVYTHEARVDAEPEPRPEEGSGDEAGLDMGPFASPRSESPPACDEVDGGGDELGEPATSARPAIICVVTPAAPLVFAAAALAVVDADRSALPGPGELGATAATPSTVAAVPLLFFFAECLPTAQVEIEIEKRTDTFSANETAD